MMMMRIAMITIRNDKSEDDYRSASKERFFAGFFRPLGHLALIILHTCSSSSSFLTIPASFIMVLVTISTFSWPKSSSTPDNHQNQDQSLSFTTLNHLLLICIRLPFCSLLLLSIFPPATVNHLYRFTLLFKIDNRCRDFKFSYLFHRYCSSSLIFWSGGHRTSLCCCSCRRESPSHCWPDHLIKLAIK